MMNCQKLIPITLGLVVVSLTTLANAQEVKTHSFELAPQISYITYKEPGVKETGAFYGLSGSYIYRGALSNELSNAMLKAEGRLIFGQVDYDGQLQDGTPYKIDNINDVLFEMRGLAGYDFDVFSSSKVTPYVGLGYRFLSDNGSKDPAGYRRFANYFYSPIGVELNTPVNEAWSIGGNLEYDIFWFGRQYSYLSDYSSAYDDLTNDQDKGYGMRASLKLTKQTEQIHFTIEPYFIYWNIGKSKSSDVVLSGSVVGKGYEPKNNSTELGAKVGFEF